MGNVDWTMRDEQENSVYWLTDDKTVQVTLHQRKYITKVRRMAAEHDDVRILHENKDGSIVAEMPLKCIKMSYPPKVELTEEQRKERSERMKAIVRR